MVHVVTPNELSAVAERLRGLVAGLDPAWVTAREAPGLWSVLEDIRRLVSGAQVVLAERVDQSEAPAKAGLRNGAEWIAQRSGGSLRSAYDVVATSRRLAELPEVTAALRDGRLSTVQATVIADAAACDPSSAGRLVGLASTVSVGELRRECLRVKTAADPDPDRTSERIRRERQLRWFVDNEGALNLSGRGPLEAGGELATVLGPIVEDVFAAAREAGIAEPREAYTWDALVEMARMAWAYMHGQTPDDVPDHAADDCQDRTADGAATDAARDSDERAGEFACPGAAGSRDADRASDGRAPGDSRCADPDGGGVEPPADRPEPGAGVVARPRRRRRGTGVNPWVRMSVRVDHAALVRGRVEGDEVCDVAGVGPIPVRVARGLLGDAVLHLLVTKGRDVATVAYLGRGQNVAQKVASSWAQPECQRLGCHRSVMEWDHREPFARNRVTETKNMQGLCRSDHRLKTLYGWELVDGVGKRPMVPPSDPRHPDRIRRRPPPHGPPLRSPSFDNPQPDELAAASPSLLSPAGV